MRSRPWKEASVRQRLMDMRWSLQRRNAPPKPAPIRVAVLSDGRCLQGHASQHLTAEARRWRTMLRLRRARWIKRWGAS